MWINFKTDIYFQKYMCIKMFPGDLFIIVKTK